MSAAAPASSQSRPVSPEDVARARWYATLAEFFRAPPSAQRLREIGGQMASPAASGVDPSPHSSPLARAWNAFAQACADADADALRQEYEAAFIGVGKAEVFLNASWHLSGYLHERPLVDLREHLALLGVARRPDVSETEDHIAALCETMAWLIVAAPEPLRSLSTQRVFFERFLSPWYETLVGAIEHCGVTDFYKHVARLLGEFLAVERQAFDFESLD
ncbi:MAG: molecular chaperone TorD family protein [Burkholderiaceae bacterium]|nr:molecular chaperone TorD family protein [Burkholderiaceae bacterium]